MASKFSRDTAITGQPIYCPLGLGRAGLSQMFCTHTPPCFVVLLLYSGKLPSPIHVVGLKALGNPFEHVPCCEFLLGIRKMTKEYSKITKSVDHITRQNTNRQKITDKIATEIRKTTDKFSASHTWQHPSSLLYCGPQGP